MDIDYKTKRSVLSEKVANAQALQLICVNCTDVGIFVKTHDKRVK